MGNVYLLEVPKETDMNAAVDSLSQSPFVEYAELPQKIEFAWVPNDPYWWFYGSWGYPYDDLWGLKKIQVDMAWDIARGNNIVVAVVDTGLDYTHPDFDAANAWFNESEENGNPANCYNGQDDDGNGKPDDCWGWDFNNNDPDPMDDLGHGTHVTGIMAAKANNGMGVVGIANGARFMILRGYDTDDLFSSAIDYAVNEGADIINCSWRTPSFLPLISAALDLAYATGVAVVASAGNYNTSVTTQNLPASHSGAITVGASTTADLKANFSNFGTYVDLVAPGGNDDNGNGDYNPWEWPGDNARHNILSLRATVMSPGYPSWLNVGANYYRMGGTSMSAPHLSGVTALVMSADSNNLTLNDIYDVLRVTSEDITAYGVGVDDQTGFGRLNAYKAVTNRCLTPWADVLSGFWAETEIRRITCREISMGCTSSNFCPSNNVTEGAAAAFVIKAKYTDDFLYPSTPQYFSDVPPTHQFFKYIQKMYADGINTAGCGLARYCLGNSIDRAHAAAYIIRAIYDENFSYTTIPYFTDVPANHWAFKYIQKMRDKEITFGYGDGTYRPANTVTRATMAVFIKRAPYKIWTKGRVDPN